MDSKAFTEEKRVVACLEQLHSKFNENNPLIVSDVLDEFGNQYVNLVQKGGGVLGVALIGYTFILEQMGIRFMRLAGTSAGAINTALLTVIDKKEDKKSEKIINALCSLNFFSLVDGHPAIRWLIKNLISNKDFTKKLTKKVSIFFITIAILLFLDILLVSLEHSYPNLAIATQFCFILTGFALLLLGGLIFYFQRLILRFKNAGFGINPGNFFYDWIKEEFKKNGVYKVSDLIAKSSQPISGLQLRIEHPAGVEGLHGDVTFIASELVSQNKIQFPKMCHLFRESNQIDTLQPAGFVRASMAIPLFFESYYINNIPNDSVEIKAAWEETLKESNPPSTTRFVDGGLLSNFPINLFFNPQIEMPRLPTFGIDLDDTPASDSTSDSNQWSFGGYFGRMLSTLKGFYDKDFLVQNDAYKKGIGKISLLEFNWLNFFLTDDDKKEMFVKGAEAATAFLMSFDWQSYKNYQVQMRKEIKRL